MELMAKLRENLPPLPARMQSLPVDERGYPVPWFVAWVEGKPEFRAMDGEKRVLAVQKKLCWVCGQPPMCAVNRISAEPPLHRECAEFSAKACPFLTIPKMVRREGGLPEDFGNPGGMMIPRNPGVTLLWFTRGYKIVKAQPSFLFRMDEPFEVAWYGQGRLATRQEIKEAIESGMTILIEAANAEKSPADRREALELLNARREVVLQMLPQ
jgi:hypothetical protein